MIRSLADIWSIGPEFATILREAFVRPLRSDFSVGGLFEPRRPALIASGGLLLSLIKSVSNENLAERKLPGIIVGASALALTVGAKRPPELAAKMRHVPITGSKGQ
jgi:hypothetical protein